MSNIVHITRRERFNAAHKLWNEKWDAQENAKVFGKCSNPNWHGHNYELFVTVKGEPHEDTGYCIDLKILSDILNDRVIDKLDHKNLNLDVAFMTGKLTSTENLAIAIWNEIVEPVNAQGCKLYCVKLYETENNFVEYFG
jgi:6-pyruvoyltetrahydropterin/6-carboxytetrahydropterin synthase